jgi:DNA-binding CsgD family transcriptional regulator
MSDLAAKDLRAVLDVIHALSDDQGEVEMPGQVLAQLGHLVSCEVMSYNRVQHTTGQLLGAVIEPADMDITGLAGFDAVFDQHPGFSAYRSGRLTLGTSVALTDLADLPTLRRLPLYTDFYRPHRINDHLMCIVQVGKKQATVLGFNRACRGFSHRDRAVADLATLHLAQAVARRQRLASLTAAVRRLSRHRDQVYQALPRLSALTPREQEVVEHLVGGVTDRQIARSLALSERTVHKHLQRIYRKLSVSNRTSLIALIHQTNDANLSAAGDHLRPEIARQTPRTRTA